LLLDIYEFFAEFEADDLLDLIEFFFVGVLGFLPLIVIQWVEHGSRVGLKTFKRAWWRANKIKTSLYLVLTDWLLNVLL
jgi:hypothetical protein